NAKRFLDFPRGGRARRRRGTNLGHTPAARRDRIDSYHARRDSKEDLRLENRVLGRRWIWLVVRLDADLDAACHLIHRRRQIRPRALSYTEMAKVSLPAWQSTLLPDRPLKSRVKMRSVVPSPASAARSNLSVTFCNSCGGSGCRP